MHGFLYQKPARVTYKLAHISSLRESYAVVKTHHFLWRKLPYMPAHMGGATGGVWGTLSPPLLEPGGTGGYNENCLPPLLGPGGTGGYKENDLPSD